MSSDEAYVCADCFDDPGIREFIEATADSQTCSFCGKTTDKPIAAALSTVVEYIEACVEHEYTDPADCLPFESAEGGYQGEVWTSAELLDEIIGLGLPNDDDGRLVYAIADNMQTQLWSRRYPFSLDDDEDAKWTWRTFCRTVRHDRRFFLVDTPGQSDDLSHLPSDLDPSPVEILSRTFDYAEAVGLFVTLKNGNRLFRARHEEPGAVLQTAQALGPPPVDLATHVNRMSPAGIAMFYASDDPETALRETADHPGTFAVGCFEILRDALILDLVDIPAVPSLFEEVSDAVEYSPRKVLKFLHHISREISRPVPRDDRMDVNYVPTQVVTEYMRFRRDRAGRAVDGIRYRSSVHAGHASYVLFATQKNLYPAPAQEYLWGREDRWLRLHDRAEYVVGDQDLKAWEAEVKVRTPDDDSLW